MAAWQETNLVISFIWASSDQLNNQSPSKIMIPFCNMFCCSAPFIAVILLILVDNYTKSCISMVKVSRSVFHLPNWCILLSINYTSFQYLHLMLLLGPSFFIKNMRRASPVWHKMKSTNNFDLEQNDLETSISCLPRGSIDFYDCIPDI